MTRRGGARRMTAAAVVAAVAVGVASLVQAAAAQEVDVLTVDCGGGVHLMSDTLLETNLNLQGVKTLVEELGKEIFEQARCACPEAPAEEVRRRFLPSVDSVLASMVHVDDGLGGFRLSNASYVNSCADDPLRSPPFRLQEATNIREYQAFGVALPSSCSYDTFLEGRGCQFKLQGGRNTTWLRDPSSSLQIYVDSCPDAMVWPYVSIKCTGPACRAPFYDACNNDGDCQEDETCKPFLGENITALGDFLRDKSFTAADSSTCTTADLGFMDFSTELFVSFLDQPSPTPGSQFDYKVCGDDLPTIWDDFTRVFGLEDDDDSEDGYGEASSDDGIFGVISEVFETFLLPDEPFLGVQVVTDVPVPRGEVIRGFDVDACLARGCHPGDIGDGFCNPLCNVPECLFDGGECRDCECLNGDDFSECSKEPEGFFFPYFFTSPKALAQDEFSTYFFPDIVPKARIGNEDFGSSTNSFCKPDSSGINAVPFVPTAECLNTVRPDPVANWYCTFTATLNNATLPPGTPLILFDSIASGSDACDQEEGLPRERVCVCAVPVDRNNCTEVPINDFGSDTVSFSGGSLERPGQCGSPKPVQTCPMTRFETVTGEPGQLSASSIEPETVDKLARTLNTPEIAPAATNVLYTTCGGDLVVNLFNSVLALGLSMPRAQDLFFAVEVALFGLDSCFSAAPASPVDQALGISVWRPEFWLAALSPDAALTAVGRTDPFREDWGGSLRDEDDSGYLSFPNAGALDLANFMGSGAARVTFEALADLLGETAFKVQAEVERCPSGPLSRFALALDSPTLSNFFTNSAPCSDVVSDTCGGDSFVCTNLAELIPPFDVQSIISNLLFGPGVEAQPACTGPQGSRRTAEFLRRLIFDFVLNDVEGSALGVTGVNLVPFEDLLLLCIPQFIEMLDSLFAEATFTCNNQGGSFECQASDPAECGSSIPDLQCSYDGGSSFDPPFPGFTSAGCSVPAAGVANCDYAVCVFSNDLPNFFFYEALFSVEHEYRSTESGLEYVDPYEQCLQTCNPGVTGRDPGGLFACHRSRCSNGPGFTFDCFESALYNREIASMGFQQDITSIVTTQGDSTCHPLFPFAFGNAMDKCCSVNPLGTDIDTRRALGDSFECSNQVLPCNVINCTDSEAAYPPLPNNNPGQCREPDVPICQGLEFRRTIDGSTDQNVFTTSLEQCEYECEIEIELGAATTCTCAVIAEGLCAEVGPDCVETIPAGPGIQWSEDQVQEVDNTTDALLSLETLASQVPASIFTEEPPRMIGANFTEDGSAIDVVFDVPTNRGLGDALIQSVGSCDKVLRFSGAAAFESALCAWVESDVLRVVLSSTSSVQELDTLALLTGNDIRVFSGSSMEASGAIVIKWDDDKFPRPTPVVTVAVPQLVSACETTLDFVAETASGAAGRAVSWVFRIYDQADLVTPLFTLNAGSVPRFSEDFATAGVTLGGSYAVGATATNWLGQSSINTFVNFEISSSFFPTIAINNNAERIVRVGVDALTLSASNSYQCPGRVDTDSFVYTWEFKRLADLNFGDPLTTFSPSSFLRLPPDFFSDPILGAGTYEFRVTTSKAIDDGTTSSDTIRVVAIPSLPTLVVLGGFQRAVFQNEPTVLDARASCNPNVALGCVPSYGQVRNGVAIADNWVTVPGPGIWTCTFFGSGTTPLPCLGLATLLANADLLLDIPPGTLQVGRYRFTLGVVPVQRDVDIEVLPPPSPGCLAPKVSIAPVDDTITLTASGFVITGFATEFTPGVNNGVRLVWSVVEDDPTSPGSRLVRPATDFSPVVNRAALVFAPGTLIPGRTYTFRLSAEQPCTGPSNHPSADVTFTVNSPPSAGRVVVDRTSGVAFESEFTFTATDFVDPDGDLPLRYAFEYTFEEPNGVVDGASTFSLSRFTESPTITTTLELPADAFDGSSTGDIFVIAVAQDPQGAQSARVNFVRGAQTDELLRTTLSLASLANSAGDSGNSSLVEWAANTRNDTLQSLNDLATNGATDRDPYLLTLQVNVLLTLLARPDETEPEFTNASLAFLRNVITDASDLVDQNKRAPDDPLAVGIVPPSLSTNALESLTNILESAKATIRESFGPGNINRRSLQQTQDACEVVQLTREAVDDLARLALKGYAQGGAARQFQSSGIQFAAARDSPGALGGASGDGLTAVGLPPPLARKTKSSGGTSNSGSPAVASGFQLPPGVLSGIDFGAGGAPSAVDVIAASFSFDINCDAIIEFTLLALDGEDCTDFEDALTYAGPISEITDVVSLNFFNTDDETQSYDPSELDEDIVVTIPQNDLLVDGTVCGEDDFTEIVCGFFDHDIKEWSTRGCSVQSVSTEGTVVCQCNHASDYSTWRAFTADVRSTFSNPVTAVTAVALLFLGVLFPAMLLIWVFGVWWSNRRDKLDADSIQKGAIGVMFLRRIQMKAKQKQFFDNLREMVNEHKKVQDLESYKEVVKTGKLDRSLRFGRGFCLNFCMAIRFEHSLLGLSRFDPHYTRAQRVSVFVAIVMGNLLAASFFFELKTADDVTAYFLIGTVFLSSLFVTIPVRFLVKVLFRTTANRQGSKYDRVSKLFRITAKIDDSGNTEAIDMDLLQGYRELLVLRQRATLLRAWIKERRSNKYERDSAALAAVDPEAHPTMEHKSLETLESELKEVNKKVNAAKRELQVVSRKAQKEWSKAPTREAVQRMNRVNRQKSVLLKMSALLADEAKPIGRVRRPMCGYTMTYVAWFLLFAFYGAAAFYITKFVLTRADQVGEGDEETAVLWLWLFTAALGVALGYLVAEPLVFFIRYALLPCIVTTCGNTKGIDDDDDADSEKRKSMASAKDKYKYDKNGKLSDQKDDDGGKSTMFWEFASDLIEAGV
ncbi:Sperm receptor for egg jelly [Durusdinium trenchii]|uniref:Sperm receptor for egg jelly n=1 Tax=Durusdinium trenchii TaxID=1381693 RepID=A0ABP0SA57_9DINO